MIQIPEPPDQVACAPCGQALTWMYSARRGAWVSFIAAGDVLRVHGCRHAQDPATWRRLPHGTPPTAEYLSVKATLRTAEVREYPVYRCDPTQDPNRIEEAS